ncbi:MAG: hypothetical protein IKB97_07850 [Bacteroidaceae bacterium]|nr:hypothetical protein [Bacteroidaceae bacterium]
MKKLLLWSLLLLFTPGLFAQTDVLTALPLEMGDVSYSFSDDIDTKTVYYVYTAPAAQDQLLTFTTTATGTTFEVSEDGRAATRLEKLTAYVGRLTAVAVPAGKRVYVKASKYHVHEIAFNVTATPINIAAGTTCSNPAQIVEEASFYLAKNKDYAPGFLEYVATTSGTLKLTFYCSISELTLGEGCGGVPVSLALGSNPDYTYSATFAVEAGKNYILSGVCYSSVVGEAELLHLEDGTSCESPFVAQEEGNVLPAAAGTYWYSYAPQTEGYLHLKSAATLPNGAVKFYSNCTAATPYLEVAGYLNVRQKVEANKNYIFCIEKAEATAEDQTFNLLTEEEKPGDAFANPLTIEPGDYVTPDYDGKTYYKVTAPAYDCFFTAATTATLANEQSGMELYAVDNALSLLQAAKQHMTWMAKAGEEFILVWKGREGLNNIPFSLTCTAIQDGETLLHPIKAEAGDHVVAEGQSERFYVYGMQNSGWLKASVSDPQVVVRFMSLDGTVNYYPMPEGNGVKVEAGPGDSLVVSLSNLTAEMVLTLEELPYADGQTCSLAFDVTDTEMELATTTGYHWYRYVAPAAGILTVGTDVPDDRAENFNMTNYLAYIEGECGGDYFYVSGGSNDRMTYSKEFVVNKGDVLMVNVRTILPVEGKHVYFELRDFVEGEAPTTAYALQPGENKLVFSSAGYPRWYYIDLQPGRFVMESPNAIHYFKAELYAANKYDRNLAVSDYVSNADMTDGVYRLSYNISEAGRYYVKLTYSMEGTLVDVTGSMVTGIDQLPVADQAVLQLNGGMLTANAPAAVYAVSGQLVGTLNGSADRGLVLARGVYIVKTAGAAYKVLVK